MKTKAFTLIGILVIAFAAMVAPVMAATTGDTAVTGNPNSFIEIIVAPATIPLTLDPAASPATSTALTVTVSCNKPPYTVTVADSTGRPGAAQGYMGNYTTSYDQGSVALNTTLQAPLSLAGSSDVAKGITGHTLSPITATAATLFDGGSAQKVVHLYDITLNTFSQAVAYDDPVLPAGSTYRMDLLFTIGLV